MFPVWSHVTAITVAAVLLMSSADVRGTSDTADCPCEERFWTVCKNVSQLPPCILSKNISALHLEFQTIAELTGQVLPSVPSMHFLNINSSSLTAVISSAFTNNPQLTEVTLHAPRLNTFQPGVFRSLPNLTSVELVLGSIGILDEYEFDLSPELFHVYIAASLQEIRAGTFRNNKELIALRLVHNNMSMLPDGLLAGNPLLQTLYLVDNGIQTISAGAFRNASKLEIIALSRNQLRTLEEGTLDDAELLTFFDASDNKITSLPSTIFAKTKALKTVILDRNILISLPKDIFESTANLEGTVQAGGDSVIVWDVCIWSDMGCLIRLDTTLRGDTYVRILSDNLNRFMSIVHSDGFGQFYQDNTLILNFNRLQSLDPELFRNTQRLALLYLAGNAFKTLPAEVFKPATGLQLLDLSWNLLYELPEDLLSNCPLLTNFNVKRNQLCSLPGRLFTNNTKLKRVNVEDNSLMSLPAEMFSGNPLLKEVGLGKNPWDCNSCDVAAMSTWLTSHDIYIGYFIPQCSKPESQAGMDIRQVTTTHCLKVATQ